MNVYDPPEKMVHDLPHPPQKGRTMAPQSARGDQGPHGWTRTCMLKRRQTNHHMPSKPNQCLACLYTPGQSVTSCQRRADVEFTFQTFLALASPTS